MDAGSFVAAALVLASGTGEQLVRCGPSWQPYVHGTGHRGPPCPTDRRGLRVDFVVVAAGACEVARMAREVAGVRRTRDASGVHTPELRQRRACRSRIPRIISDETVPELLARHKAVAAAASSATATCIQGKAATPSRPSPGV